MPVREACPADDRKSEDARCDTHIAAVAGKLAEDGYSKSAVSQIRTYLKACFEYAADEGLIAKSPARKLVMPKIRKKACERFLSVEEFRALLSHAAPREHLVLRILGVCGLRPGRCQIVCVNAFSVDLNCFPPEPPVVTFAPAGRRGASKGAQRRSEPLLASTGLLLTACRRAALAESNGFPLVSSECNVHAARACSIRSGQRIANCRSASRQPWIVCHFADTFCNAR